MTTTNEVQAPVKSNMDIWQDLMNAAYDKWQEDQDMRAWFKTLTPFEKQVVAVGKYNQQVNNGGHSQWSFNGYKDIQEYMLKKTLEEASKDGVKAAEDALNVFNYRYESRDDKFYAITTFEEEMAAFFVKKAKALKLI